MSSGFRSSCYWTDWNWANTENIRIGLVFAVLEQWKFLHYIDRFDHIKANKSKLINNYCYEHIFTAMNIYLLLRIPFDCYAHIFISMDIYVPLWTYIYWKITHNYVLLWTYIYWNKHIHIYLQLWNYIYCYEHIFTEMDLY